MTAPELSADERARVAAFDAAPVLAESSPIVRAVLALAEEMDAIAEDYDADWTMNGDVESGARANSYDVAADRIRATVAAVLAADPEPRDAVANAWAWGGSDTTPGR